MTAIKRFEDIEAWQQARIIAKEINVLIHKEKLRHNFALVDQIRRSSGSIMDNIAEGYERDGNKEFVYFLSIAKGSAGETRSQLYRALDQGYITPQEFECLCSKLVHVSVLISNLMKYIKSSGMKGRKFK